MKRKIILFIFIISFNYLISGEDRIKSSLGLNLEYILNRPRPLFPTEIGEDHGGVIGFNYKYPSRIFNHDRFFSYIGIYGGGVIGNGGWEEENKEIKQKIFVIIFRYGNGIRIGSKSHGMDIGIAGEIIYGGIKTEDIINSSDAKIVSNSNFRYSSKKYISVNPIIVIQVGTGSVFIKYSHNLMEGFQTFGIGIKSN